MKIEICRYVPLQGTESRTYFIGADGRIFRLALDTPTYGRDKQAHRVSHWEREALGELLAPGVISPKLLLRELEDEDEYILINNRGFYRAENIPEDLFPDCMGLRRANRDGCRNARRPRPRKGGSK